MNGTQPHEIAMHKADPAGHAVYLGLRGLDDRCDRCRMAHVCPDAWEGTFECPDLDHLLKGEEA